jgi:hypothetical protein
MCGADDEIHVVRLTLDITFAQVSAISDDVAEFMDNYASSYSVSRFPPWVVNSPAWSKEVVEGKAAAPKRYNGDCPICFTPCRKDGILLCCGHVFDDSCFDAIVSSRSTCPICRESTLDRYMLLNDDVQEQNMKIVVCEGVKERVLHVKNTDTVHDVLVYLRVVTGQAEDCISLKRDLEVLSAMNTSLRLHDLGIQNETRLTMTTKLQGGGKRASSAGGGRGAKSSKGDKETRLADYRETVGTSFARLQMNQAPAPAVANTARHCLQIIADSGRAGQTYIKRVVDDKSLEEKRSITRAMSSGNVEHRYKTLAKVLMADLAEQLDNTEREVKVAKQLQYELVQMLMLQCYGDDQGAISWGNFTDDVTSEPLPPLLEGQRADADVGGVAR